MGAGQGNSSVVEHVLSKFEKGEMESTYEEVTETQPCITSFKTFILYL